MFNLEERLSKGLKILHALQPQRQPRRRAARHSASPFTPNTSVAEYNRTTWRNQPSHPEAWLADQPDQSPIPVLETVLSQETIHAPYTALLGLCDDGLPLLLDFANPVPGSVLVVGDRDSGLFTLQRSILTSITRLNRPTQATIILAVQNPEAFQQFEGAPHCQEIVSMDKVSLAELVDQMSSTMRSRQSNGVRDPAILLAIDNLATFLDPLDSQSLATFHRLIKHGPRSRIWTLAGLDSEAAYSIDRRLLDAFRTHLVCGIRNQRTVRYLSGDDRLDTRRLDFENQFFAPYGDQWLRSWICRPQSQGNQAQNEEGER